MENLHWGVISFLACGIISALAFHQFQRGNSSYSLVLLLLSGFLLRFYTSCDWYLHEWDERYHALVAKNMMESPLKPMLYKTPVLPFNMESWTSNHVWLHKHPVPLWSMALSMKLFGVNELALRLPSIILSTSAIGFTYLIGKKLLSARVGFIAAFLHSINGLVIELTSGRVPTDHIDIFFLFFIEFAFLMLVCNYEKGDRFYLVICGMCTGLAVLTKWLPALIVMPCYVLINLNKPKKFDLALGIVLISVPCLMIVLPWIIYINNAFPVEAAIESSHRLRHFTEVLDDQGGNFFFHFIKATAVVHEFVWVAFVFVFIYALRTMNLKVFTLLLWIIIPYIFFSLAQTKMQGYLTFCSPAAFLILSKFYDEYLKSVFNKALLNQILVAIFFILPVRYSIERTKVFHIRERNPVWVFELKKYNNLPAKTVVFGEPHNIEAMFYSDVVAYNYVPEQRLIDSVKQLGYNVILK